MRFDTKVEFKKQTITYDPTVGKSVTVDVPLRTHNCHVIHTSSWEIMEGTGKIERGDYLVYHRGKFLDDAEIAVIDNHTYQVKSSWRIMGKAGYRVSRTK